MTAKNHRLSWHCRFKWKSIRIQYCFYSNGAAHWSIHGHVIQIIWRSCRAERDGRDQNKCLCICRVGAKTPVYAECSCRVQKVKLWKLKLRFFRLRQLGTEHYRASHKGNSFRQNSDHGKEACSMKLKLLRKMKSTALKSGLACDRQGWRNGGILLDGFSGIGERYLLSIVAWGRTSTGSRSGFRTRAEGLVDSLSHHRLLLVTWTPVRIQARNILVHGDRRNVTVLNIVTLKDSHTRSSNRILQLFVHNVLLVFVANERNISRCPYELKLYLQSSAWSRIHQAFGPGLQALRAFRPGPQAWWIRDHAESFRYDCIDMWNQLHQQKWMSHRRAHS